MKRLILLIAVAGGVACSSAWAGNDADRQKWIDGAVVYLKTIQPTNTTRMAEIQVRNAGTILRYVLETEGLIKCGTNDWVYLKMNSACDADERKGALGDCLLAIDQDGNLYQNDTHVCEGIVLKTLTGKTFRSTQEFLDTPVLKEKWRILTNGVARRP